MLDFILLQKVQKIHELEFWYTYFMHILCFFYASQYIL